MTERRGHRAHAGIASLVSTSSFFSLSSITTFRSLRERPSVHPGEKQDNRVKMLHLELCRSDEYSNTLYVFSVWFLVLQVNIIACVKHYYIMSHKSQIPLR